MRVQIRSLDQAVNNSQNASSLLKVADGALTDTVDILRTMKEKAVNAANDNIKGMNKSALTEYLGKIGKKDASGKVYTKDDAVNAIAMQFGVSPSYAQGVIQQYNLGNYNGYDANFNYYDYLINQGVRK